MTMVDLDTRQKTELAETFGLLADPTRLSVVLSCLDQERSAGDIARDLGVSSHWSAITSGFYAPRACCALNGGVSISFMKWQMTVSTTS